MAMVVQRFEVYLVNLDPTVLDPTVGAEMQKSRPCVILSPDEMNRHLATVIVAPLTTQGKAYPTRIACQLGGKSGLAVLDQLRTVDKVRLVKCLGRLTTREQQAIVTTLVEMFAA